MELLTPYMMLAIFAYLLLLLGLLLRKKRKTHVRLMVTGMAIDLAIVATLEIQRQAIATALSFSLSPLQQAHIAVSSVATILYFPVLLLGFLRWRKRIGLGGRKWHIILGLTAFFFRSLGLIFMFSLLGPK